MNPSIFVFVKKKKEGTRFVIKKRETDKGARTYK